jgi:hypothetical protein
MRNEDYLRLEAAVVMSISVVLFTLLPQLMLA